MLLLSSTAHSFGLIGGLLHSLRGRRLRRLRAPGLGPRHPADCGGPPDHRPVRRTHALRTARRRHRSPRLPDAADRGVGRRDHAPGGRGAVHAAVRRRSRRVVRDHGDRHHRDRCRRHAAPLGRPGGAGRVGSAYTRANWTSPSTSRPISSTRAAPSTPTAGSTPGTGPRWTRAGAVRVRGRADSLVVIGGLKVDLTEVENVLRDHPAVEQAVLVHEEPDRGVRRGQRRCGAAVGRGVVAVVPGAAGRLQGAARHPAAGRVAAHVQREVGAAGRDARSAG